MLPLVMEAGNMIEMVNRKNKDLDVDDLVDDIDRVLVEGDLSPKQIQSLNTKHGKQQKIIKSTGARMIQTWSHMLKSLSK